jgi:hypothetical protein
VTIYLDADSVINALIRVDFIKNQIWKSPKATKYTARFFHGTTNGTLYFEIHVEGGIHKLSATYIDNLARLYGRNLSAIVANCVI